MWNIEGKNFLITGGASGLGAGYAESFLKNGAQNVAVLDIAEEVGLEFVRKLNETYGDKAIFIKCDVSKEDDIKSSFEKAIGRFKKIDVIINNAGIFNDAPNMFLTACDINWRGIVSFSIKGMEHMRKDKGGSGGTIINISSVGSIIKFSIFPIYCGSKAAVLHFGRCISSPEFNDTTGVRVLTLVLGATKTAILDELSSKAFDRAVTKSLISLLQISEQRIDSAVAAVVKMYREGTPGSVWLSIHDRPGQDITDEIDETFRKFDKLLAPEGYATIEESLYTGKCDSN